MKKKVLKRRMSRLMNATTVYLWDVYDEQYYLAKPAKKPLNGKSIRRLLGDGMYDYLGQISFSFSVLENWGWAFGYPKFNANRKYIIRFDEALYGSHLNIYVDRA